MGDISQLCNNFQFVGPWQFCTLKYHPIKSNPAHLEHEKKIRQLLHHYTSSTMVPFLCLAIEEGCQWPQVLLVQPNAKLWARAVRCYILERIDPKPNDFNHTVNAVPPRESLCTKTFTMCNNRNFCVAHGKLHLSHFPIKNILSVALYRKEKGLTSAFSINDDGHYDLKKTKQAKSILEEYHQCRKMYYNDSYVYV